MSEAAETSTSMAAETWKASGVAVVVVAVVDATGPAALNHVACISIDGAVPEPWIDEDEAHDHPPGNDSRWKTRQAASGSERSHRPVGWPSRREKKDRQTTD